LAKVAVKLPKNFTVIRKTTRKMQAIKPQNSQQPANNLLNRYTLFLKLDLSFVDLQLPKY